MVYKTIIDKAKKNIMSDNEILKYLQDHNFLVDAQDCLVKVINTSMQIINKEYDFKTGTMTLSTPDNVFVFGWKLKEY